LFCGGTASGKTTALNALILFIPYSYKILSIDDTREVNLPHENWIVGTTRTGFTQVEGSKSGKNIDMFDLIRAALRQRPKVIIVGEVRGKEAYTLFQAMTTGHLSYSTVHAGDIRTLIQRLESPPINLPRSLLTALDAVVFMNSVIANKKPARRFTTVMEIIKLDSGTNRLITFTPFSWVSEFEDRFQMEDGSRILQRIKAENEWSDEELNQEFENRKRILVWMIEKKINLYKDVANIISEYYKNPSSILKKIKEDGV
jgi:flagellar protein FlaI